MLDPSTGLDFVLVHGAFADASEWSAVVPLLEASGAKVTAFDLPAHAATTNGEAGKTTLADYVAATRAIVERSSRPVVLVGHSVAGVAIAQTAEAVPEKIAALVFVCAFLPEDGRSAMSYAENDPASRFGANFMPDEGRGVGTMTAEALIETVFNETAPETARAAADVGASRDEPLEPFGAAVSLSAGRFGSIRRYYVMTEHDHAITPDLQQAMLDATPCERVFTLRSDHAPMASAPEELAEALIDVRRHAGAAVRGA